MKLKKIIAGHLIVLGLVFPNIVSAEQFTFNVGLNFSNIHEDVDQVRVQCRVRTSEREGEIGRTSNDVSVPANGTLNTTVQVKFNVNPGINPADAKFYVCLLFFPAPGGGVSLVQSANSPSCTGERVGAEQRCAKPGAPFSGAVFTGPIP